MEQIGIGMILTGLAGMRGVTEKIIYKAFGINELIFAVCWMIAIIGIVLISTAAG